MTFLGQTEEEMLHILRRAKKTMKNSVGKTHLSIHPFIHPSFLRFIYYTRVYISLLTHFNVRKLRQCQQEELMLFHTESFGRQL